MGHLAKNSKDQNITFDAELLAAKKRKKRKRETTTRYVFCILLANT